VSIGVERERQRFIELGHTVFGALGTRVHVLALFAAFGDDFFENIHHILDEEACAVKSGVVRVFLDDYAAGGVLRKYNHDPVFDARTAYNFLNPVAHVVSFRPGIGTEFKDFVMDSHFFSFISLFRCEKLRFSHLKSNFLFGILTVGPKNDNLMITVEFSNMLNNISIQIILPECKAN
jgi:hypothetical protein